MLSKTRKKEIIEFCLSRTTEELKPFLNTACEIADKFRGGDISERDAPTIIETAGTIFSIQSEKPSSMENFHQIINPDQLILRNEMLNWILPQIISLRKELFGVDTPPFNLTDSIEWMQLEANKEAIEIQDRYNTRIHDAINLKNKMFELKDELEKSSPIFCQISYELNYIPYPSKNINRDLYPVYRNTLLWNLWAETKKLEDMTYFSQQSLVLFTLTEIKPFPISYSITKSFSSSGIKSSINILINRELNYREFQRLIKETRTFFRYKGKRLSEKQLKLYLFFSNINSIPDKHKMKYWDKMWINWNSQNPSNKFKSSHCLRIAYFRFQKKMENIPSDFITNLKKTIIY